MSVRQEDVEAVLAPAAMLAQNAIAELAYTAAEITQYVFIAAGDNFDAARIGPP